MPTQPPPTLPAAPPCGTCLSAQISATLPENQRRLKGGYPSLLALLLPGLVLAAGLWTLRGHPRYQWLTQPLAPHAFPWEIWVMALAGGVATIGGLLDWHYHRWIAKCRISKAEQRCELLAMTCGGGSMIAIMSAASIGTQPRLWLLPALVVLVFTVCLICYDEFIYHRRRCTRLETLHHRLLVFGMGTAWLAWAHWCFVR